MDIGDVRQRTGLTAATLRHYEDIGLIESIGRNGLRRQYDSQVIERLSVIVLCQRSGFTLAEIADLLERRDETSWRTSVEAKLSELETQIAALDTARAGLQHARDCPSTDIMHCEHFRASLDSVFTTPTQPNL